MERQTLSISRRRSHVCHCFLVRKQEEERQLHRELDAAQRRVHEALCDNINTQVGCTGHARL